MKALSYASRGTVLHAVEAGAGEVLVLLHGGMADHHAVLPYLQPLATRFRVVAPDLRGSGRSWYGGSLSFEQLADDVRALLEHVQTRRAVVVGVSSGTGVALRLALAHPERLAGLGLVLPLYAGTAGGYTEPQRAIFSWMDSLASQAVAQGIDVIRPLFASLPGEIREQAMAVALRFDPASVASTSRFLASGAQPMQSTEELRRIRMPVLIVPGTDAMHPPEVADAYARALPNARLVHAGTAGVADALAAFSQQCFDDGG